MTGQQFIDFIKEHHYEDYSLTAWCFEAGTEESCGWSREIEIDDFTINDEFKNVHITGHYPDFFYSHSSDGHTSSFRTLEEALKDLEISNNVLERYGTEEFPNCDILNITDANGKTHWTREDVLIG